MSHVLFPPKGESKGKIKAKFRSECPLCGQVIRIGALIAYAPGCRVTHWYCEKRDGSR